MLSFSSKNVTFRCYLLMKLVGTRATVEKKKEKGKLENHKRKNWEKRGSGGEGGARNNMGTVDLQKKRYKKRRGHKKKKKAKRGKTK